MNIRFRAFAPEDWAWVNSCVEILQVQDTSGIMAFDIDSGELVGACIMDNWTANSVQAHFMVSNPMVLRHGLMEEVFGYVFQGAGKKFIYGLVPGDNEKALKLNAHMGFTEKMRLEDAWADGIDYVLVELKKENCKHLPVEEAA